MALRVNGVDDKAGLAVVHKARMDCVRARTTCEKEHKAAKEDALKECKRIDGVRRELLALIEPVETYLTEQENAVEAEIERIRLAKWKAEQAVFKERFRQLEAVECRFSPSVIEVMTDQDFASFLEQATAVHEAKVNAEQEAESERVRLQQEEDDRRAAEAERLRVESENLAKERAALERQRKSQEAEAERLKNIEEERIAAQNAELQKQRDELAAEQKRLADEEAARQRQIENERIAKESAERSRIETEERLQREAEEAKARAAMEAEQAERQKKLDEEARQREEAMRPDREKLLAVADAIQAIQLPAVTSSMAAKREQVVEIIENAANEIRSLFNKKK